MGNGKSKDYSQYNKNNEESFGLLSSDDEREIEYIHNQSYKTLPTKEATDDERPAEVYETHSLNEFDEYYQDRSSKFLNKIRKFTLENLWLFLILTGIVISITCFGIDIAIEVIKHGQLKVVNLLTPVWLKWITWIAWCIALALLAALVVIFISPHAAGSGIPEMKCILSGITMNRFLNFRTLVAKIIGLIFTISSGYPVGKEGPFVHISAIICSLMSKIPTCSGLRKNHAAFLLILGAACSVGVTATFGTPVGGVLFSMEVTSSFYLIDNLWRSFLASLTGVLMYTIMRNFIPIRTNIFQTEWDIKPYFMGELFAYAVMGIVLGVFGTTFIKLLRMTFHLSRINEKLQTAWGILLRNFVISIIIAPIIYPLPLMRDEDSLGDFLSRSETLSSWKMLILIMFLKYFLTILSVGFSGVVAGIYAPLLVEGAIMGRLFGEIMAAAFPQYNISPSSYSIVGAAAFASGVTRTISTAIIVVEVTFQSRLLLPVLVSVMTANLICRFFGPSVYSILIADKDLPMMPRFKLFNKQATKYASDIMDDRLIKLSTQTTFIEAAKLVASCDYPTFPVTDEDGIFLGIVRRAHICKILDYFNVNWRKYREPKSIKHKALEIMKHNFDQIQNTRLQYDEDKSKRNDSVVNISEKLPQLQRDKFNILEDDPEGVTNIEILETPLPLKFNVNSDVSNIKTEGCIDIDSSIMSTSVYTSLTKVHFLFTALGVSHIYITKKGKLVGIITRKRIIKAINAMNFM